MIFEDGIHRLGIELQGLHLKYLGLYIIYDEINKYIYSRLCDIYRIRLNSDIDIMKIPEEMISGYIRDMQWHPEVEEKTILKLVNELEKRGGDKKKLRFKMGVYSTMYTTAIKPCNFYTYLSMNGFITSYKEYKRKIINNFNDVENHYYMDTWLGKFYWRNQKQYGIVFNKELLPPKMSNLLNGGLYL